MNPLSSRILAPLVLSSVVLATSPARADQSKSGERPAPEIAVLANVNMALVRRSRHGAVQTMLASSPLAPPHELERTHRPKSRRAIRHSSHRVEPFVPDPLSFLSEGDAPTAASPTRSKRFAATAKATRTTNQRRKHAVWTRH